MVPVKVLVDLCDDVSSETQHGGERDRVCGTKHMTQCVTIETCQTKADIEHITTW